MLETHNSHKVIALLNRRLTTQETKKLVETRMGTIMNILLFTHAPRKYRLFTSMLSVDLWRHGAGDKVLRVLQELGICVNAAAARRCVDGICAEYKQELKSWKETTSEVHIFQVQLQNTIHL